MSGPHPYDDQSNLTTATNGQSPTQIEAKLEYNGQSGGSCPNDAATKRGTLRCAIDGNGNRTLYSYDAQGNLTKVTPPAVKTPDGALLGETTLTYDGLSRLRTVRDGKGQTETFSYDPLDRITKVDYSDGSSIAYSYDANGNQTARTDSAHGTSSYAYDRLNRRTKDTLPGSLVADYGYDAAGNLTSLTDGGGTVSYAYDAANLLAELTEPDTKKTTFGYDMRDNRTSTTLPNGVVEGQSFDDSDKPTKVEAKKGTSVLLSHSYSYRKPSTSRDIELRHSVTDKDGATTTYDYDGLDRLKSTVTKSSAGTTTDSRSWSYDQASNRKTQTVNATTTSYAYNAANQLCWSVGASSSAGCDSPPTGARRYAYDANGSETSASGVRTSAFNIRDQLATLTPAGATATSFAYAGQDNSERVKVGTANAQNTLLGVSSLGSTYWTRDDEGQLIAQRSGTAKHYYLHDALGSTVGLTDSAGALSSSYRYDAFGQSLGETGTTSNPWRFAGEYRESAGSLYKIGARYYDPSIGRWTQRDPLDQPDDLRQGSRYVYAAADPVNLTDPSGTIVPALVGAVVRFGAPLAYRAASAAIRRAPAAVRSGRGVRYGPGGRAVRTNIHRHAGGPHTREHIQTTTFRRGISGSHRDFRWPRP